MWKYDFHFSQAKFCFPYISADLVIGRRQSHVTYCVIDLTPMEVIDSDTRDYHCKWIRLIKPASILDKGYSCPTCTTVYCTKCSSECALNRMTLAIDEIQISRNIR